MQHRLLLIAFNPGVRVLQTGEKHPGLIWNSTNITKFYKITPAEEL